MRIVRAYPGETFNSVMDMPWGQALLLEAWIPPEAPHAPG